MTNKLPYTKEKPRAIVNYRHQYGDCPEHPIKIYDNHVVMSRDGFQDLLFGAREYYLLDDIYKTVGQLRDGKVYYSSLFPSRKVGEY